MRNTERSIRALVTVLALALLPVTAQAQDTTQAKPNRWRFIGTDNNGDSTFIDTKSIVREQGLDEATVWVEARFKSPRSNIFGSNYARFLAREIFSCKRRTAHVIDWSSYTKNGSLAGSSDGLTAKDAIAPVFISISQEVPPNTVAEAILEAVCSPSSERAQTSNSAVNYPPTPTKLFIPPLPIPDRVRGFHLLAEYEVDEMGKVVDFKFTPTPDAAYNRRLEEMLKSFTFRPGTTPDGTPV
jgi:hypothetical protein